MKFLVYSEVTAARIATSMGLPEYSYYFVLRDFLPVLKSLGDVQVIEEPAREVDALYDQACAAGLGACVAIGAVVEGVASTSDRRHPRDRKGHRVGGLEHQVDAAR